MRPEIRIEESTPTFARVHIEPLERGYGATLGNSLRRVLLSSIRGAAISSVRIDGVLHEFSTVPGVREDVIEILLNLKHIPVRSFSNEVRVLNLEAEGGRTVTAADIQPDSEVEFVKPDAHICTMEEGARLSMQIYVEQGVGYASMERPRPAYLPVDALMVDAIFSPVLKVNFDVEAARVGQRTDYERLVLQIWTNGVHSPESTLCLLSADRQSELVPLPPVASYIHESLDIHGHFPAKISFDLVVIFYLPAEFLGLFLCEVLHPSVRIYSGSLNDLL
jgi:DNA-directed RNA polymerase subunit alpha